MKYLQNILLKLNELNQKGHIDYYIPALWLENQNTASLNMSAPEYFINRILRIEELAKEKTHNNKRELVYNMFVRLSAAYDHNNNGDISVQPLGSGFRETGTFLKAMSMLPYLKMLGVTSIYFLPVTSIGKSGNKGNLGSPYAIDNHYKFDENLTEPALGLSAEEEFAAFSEAAKSLGMKIILEFVFRTSAISSKLALEHPNWFYWIEEEYAKDFHAPVFDDETIKIIKEKIENNDLENLPAADKTYIKKFSAPPDKITIDKNGRIIGTCTETDKTLTIPGAFADWPPNDTQPAWSDVTYLKLYDDPDYNYMAYNTLRMYEKALAVEDNQVKDLWDYITNIIPYYIKQFDIDGVMIDMGHALPAELLEQIISKARDLKSDFIFWEENFLLTEKSVKTGYNGVLGFMPFDSHDAWKLKKIISMFEEKKCPVPFFATPETHNTPRAAIREGGVDFSKLIYALSAFLPAIHFIHSGFELGETMPVNTGLGFDQIDTSMLTPDKLPLFSAATLSWNNNTAINDIIKINKLTSKLKIDKNTKYELLETWADDIIAYKFTIDSDEYVFTGNMTPDYSEASVSLSKKQIAENMLDDAECELFPNVIKMNLFPWGFKIFKIDSGNHI